MPNTNQGFYSSHCFCPDIHPPLKPPCSKCRGYTQRRQLWGPKAFLLSLWKLCYFNQIIESHPPSPYPVPFFFMFSSSTNWTPTVCARYFPSRSLCIKKPSGDTHQRWFAHWKHKGFTVIVMVNWVIKDVRINRIWMTNNYSEPQGGFCSAGVLQLLKGHLQKVQRMANKRSRTTERNEVTYHGLLFFNLFFFVFWRPLLVMPQEQFQLLVKDKQWWVAKKVLWEMTRKASQLLYVTVWLRGPR